MESGARWPAFLITIDTEGDDLWSRPREITTHNAEYLPRFQELCEKYAFKPSWLTNFEMAKCPRFQSFARDVLQRGTGEVGMHPHAWNSPPLVGLTRDDFQNQPYLYEFPADVMREKLNFLTHLLRDTFSCPVVSHRAGRWGLSGTYARMLAELGFRIDCSVTPGVSWQRSLGDPAGAGGPDYTEFPEQPYYLDLDQLQRPGDSRLLEVPMTIVRHRRGRLAGALRHVAERCPGRLPGRIAARLIPEVQWLRPARGNLEPMLKLVAEARRRRVDYLEFMLHSSEFMPGGSPRFPTAASIENLFDHLDTLFAAIAEHFRGATLLEFHDAWAAHPLPDAQPTTTPAG